MAAAWVLTGSDVPAERESNGQGIIASSAPPEFFCAPGQCPRREGRSYTCLSNGKLERNIGECAGSGVLSHSPAERLDVEPEFEQKSRVIERIGANGGNDRVHYPAANRSGKPRTAEPNTLHSSKILESLEEWRSESAPLIEFGALQFLMQVSSDRSSANSSYCTRQTQLATLLSDR